MLRVPSRRKHLSVVCTSNAIKSRHALLPRMLQELPARQYRSSDEYGCCHGRSGGVLKGQGGIEEKIVKLSGSVKGVWSQSGFLCSCFILT